MGRRPSKKVTAKEQLGADAQSLRAPCGPTQFDEKGELLLGDKAQEDEFSRQGHDTDRTQGLSSSHSKQDNALDKSMEAEGAACQIAGNEASPADELSRILEPEPDPEESDMESSGQRKPLGGVYDEAEDGLPLDPDGQPDPYPGAPSSGALVDGSSAYHYHGEGGKDVDPTKVHDLFENETSKQTNSQPDEVRSIYLRHKGVEGDGVAMARELAGMNAFGKGRGEVHQIAKLRAMQNKLQTYWRPVLDAKPGEEEIVIDEKDKISTKAAISITTISGINGLTQEQYDTLYSVVQAVLQIVVTVVAAILTKFYLVQYDRVVPDELISWLTAAVMKVQPFYSRSRVNVLLHERLERFKVRGRMVVFYETMADKKIKKRKKGKSAKETSAGNSQAPAEEQAEPFNPRQLTGKYTATQVISFGDMIEREVGQRHTEAAFFHHVTFDCQGVPHDKKRSREVAHSVDEGLGRCAFENTPFWANRQELFGRLANFGAMADSAAPEVLNKIEADGERVGIFRAKLFIQDSKLRLDMGGKRKLLDQIYQRNVEGTIRERVHLEQSAVEVFVRGEPIIASQRTITNDILRVKDFSDYYEPGDALWEVDICETRGTWKSRVAKRKRNQSSSPSDPTHDTNSMKHGFREHRAFVRFSTLSQEPSEKDPRKDYCLVIFDNNRERRGDVELSFDQIKLLWTPEGWRQGDLRPITGEPLPKDYMAHRMGPDGIPEVHVPLALYSDDTSVSSWTKAKVGGFYAMYPAFSPDTRTASQAIRCISATTNKVQSDAVVESCVEELTSLADIGRVVQTLSHGPVRVFFHVVYHICDFPQSAASTDVMGHSADAHCSICGIRVNKKALATYAELRCSADISLTRSDARTAALRERFQNCEAETKIGKQLNYLGLSKEALRTPLNVLDEKFEMHGETEWPRNYKPAFSPFRQYADCAKESARYDSHQCSVSAIDHVIFCGCCSDSLEFQFDMLPTPSVRVEFSEKIVEACKLSGLRYPSSVLKQSASHSEGYVNSLGVGDISACALMGSICLTSIEADEVEVHPESYEVMNGMNGIVRTVYHTARPTTSTRSEAQDLKNKAKRLVDLVATYMLLLVALTAKAKFKDAAIKFTNKPNLHRLLEFAFFWWPAIGFAVVHVAELIFEKFNQVLKQYALRTNNKHFMGFEIMQKIRLDECLKRLIAAEDMGEVGPMRLFNWTLGRFSGMIWRIVKRLVSAGPRSGDANSAQVNFMSLVPDRQWMSKGTLPRMRTGLLVTSIMSDTRAKKVIQPHLRSTYNLFHDYYEFECLNVAEFGKNANFHHQLKRGFFVSGITDVDVSKEELLKVREAEFFIPGRMESKLESDDGTTFGKNRFTLLICEIWRAQDVLHGGEIIESLYVRGIPLFPREKVQQKNGLTLWDTIDVFVWKELDCSCRRVAGFSWSGVRADGSDGGAVIEPIRFDYTHTSVSEGKKFVLLHEKDGYPSRQG